MEVGGLALQIAEAHHEHVRWPRLKLSINDTLVIKLTEVDEADAPRRRYRSDAKVQESPYTEEEILEMQKEQYLWLKKKFEGESGA